MHVCTHRVWKIMKWNGIYWNELHIQKIQYRDNSVPWFLSWYASISEASCVLSWSKPSIFALIESERLKKQVDLLNWFTLMIKCGAINFVCTARPRDTRFLVPGKNRAAQNRASWGLYLCTKWDFFSKNSVSSRLLFKIRVSWGYTYVPMGIYIPYFQGFYKSE